MTIHGVIKVMVRLSVDRSGRVSNEAIEVPGPSKYFARLATEAAKKWRFSTATSEDARKRLLQFEFSRSGTTVNIINLR